MRKASERLMSRDRQDAAMTTAARQVVGPQSLRPSCGCPGEKTALRPLEHGPSLVVS